MDTGSNTRDAVAGWEAKGGDNDRIPNGGWVDGLQHTTNWCHVAQAAHSAHIAHPGQSIIKKNKNN